MTSEEIEAAWSSLVPPRTIGEISGKRATGQPSARPAYLAIDGQRYRHLLVQLPDDTPPVTQRSTRSLQVTTSRFQVGSNQEALYVDLLCSDPSQYPTFLAVTQDILQRLQENGGTVRDTIINSLARWRTFWTSRPLPLDREEALGLFGELWFMRHWLGPVDAKILAGWQATEQARHDFQWHSISIEVKTSATRRNGNPIHRISSLAQLEDPLEGQLLLFSLHVAEDSLSSNTLHSIVEQISVCLKNDFSAASSFSGKLATRGYSADDTQEASRPYRILEEALYQVSQGFPRLTADTFKPSGPPVGVVDISYAIDLAGCEKWLLGKTPTDEKVRKILCTT